MASGAMVPNPIPGPPQQQFVLADHVHLLNEIAAAANEIPAAAEYGQLMINVVGSGGASAGPDHDRARFEREDHYRRTHSHGDGQGNGNTFTDAVAEGECEDDHGHHHDDDEHHHHDDHHVREDDPEYAHMRYNNNNSNNPNNTSHGHDGGASAMSGSAMGGSAAVDESLGITATATTEPAVAPSASAVEANSNTMKEVHFAPGTLQLTAPIPNHTVTQFTTARGGLSPPRNAARNSLPTDMPPLDPRFNQSVMTTASMPLPTAYSHPHQAAISAPPHNAGLGSPGGQRTSFHAYGHVETGSLASAHTLSRWQTPGRGGLPSGSGAPLSPTPAQRTASSTGVGVAPAVSSRLGSPAASATPVTGTTRLLQNPSPAAANQVAITGSRAGAPSPTIPGLRHQSSTSTTSLSGSRRVSGTPLSQGRNLAQGQLQSPPGAMLNAGRLSGHATSSRASNTLLNAMGSPMLSSPMLSSPNIMNSPMGAGATEELRPFVRLGRMARRRDSLVGNVLDAGAHNAIRSPVSILDAGVIGNLNSVLNDALAGGAMSSRATSGTPANGQRVLPTAPAVIRTGGARMTQAMLAGAGVAARNRAAAVHSALMPASAHFSTPAYVRTVNPAATGTGMEQQRSAAEPPASARGTGALLSAARMAATQRHGVLPTPRSSMRSTGLASARGAGAQGAIMELNSAIIGGATIVLPASFAPTGSLVPGMSRDASPSISGLGRGVPAASGPDAVIMFDNSQSGSGGTVPPPNSDADRASPVFQPSARSALTAAGITPHPSKLLPSSPPHPPPSASRHRVAPMPPSGAGAGSVASSQSNMMHGYVPSPIVRATPRTAALGQITGPQNLMLPPTDPAAMNSPNSRPPSSLLAFPQPTVNYTPLSTNRQSSAGSQVPQQVVRLMNDDNTIDIDAVVNASAQLRQHQRRAGGEFARVGASPYTGTRMLGGPLTVGDYARDSAGDMSARTRTPGMSARWHAASMMARHEGAFAPPQIDMAHLRLGSAPAPMVSFVSGGGAGGAGGTPGGNSLKGGAPKSMRRTPNLLSVPGQGPGSADATPAQSPLTPDEVLPGQVAGTPNTPHQVARVLTFATNVVTFAPDGDSAVAALNEVHSSDQSELNTDGTQPVPLPTPLSARGGIAGGDTPAVLVDAPEEPDALPVIEPLTHEQGLEWDAKIFAAQRLGGGSALIEAINGGDTVTAREAAVASNATARAASHSHSSAGQGSAGKSGAVEMAPLNKDAPPLIVSEDDPADAAAAAAAAVAAAAAATTVHASPLPPRRRYDDEQSVSSAGSVGSTSSLASLTDSATHMFYANTNPVNFFLYPSNPKAMTDSLLLRYHNGEGLWGWFFDCFRSKASIRERQRQRLTARGVAPGEADEEDDEDTSKRAAKSAPKKQELKAGDKVDDQGNVYRDDGDDDQQFRKMIQEAFERARAQNDADETVQPEEQPPPPPPARDVEEEARQAQAQSAAEEARLKAEKESAAAFYMDDDLVSDLEAGFGLLYHEVFADQMRVFVLCFTLLATLFCALYARDIGLGTTSIYVISATADDDVAFALSGGVLLFGVITVVVLTVTARKLQNHNDALSLHHRIMNQGNELQNQDLRGYTLHSAVTNMNVSRNYNNNSSSQQSGGHTVSTSNITLNTADLNKSKPAEPAATSMNLLRSWMLNHLQFLVGLGVFVFAHILIVAMVFSHILHTGLGAVLLLSLLVCVSMQSTLLFPGILIVTVTIFVHFTVAMLVHGGMHATDATYVYIALVAVACILLLRTAHLAERGIRSNYINTHRAVHEEGRALYLLSQMLPPEVLLTIVHTDNSNFAQHFETASILFADVVSFTAMSAQLLPEELVMFLNVMFSVFDQCATIRSIYKVETIGDCYFACAGIVHSLTNFEALPAREHARNLVHFGMDIVFFLSLLPHPLASKRAKQMRLAAKRAARERKAERERDRELAKTGFFRVRAKTKKVDVESELPPIPPMGLRVGIHTGYVTAGVVGRTMPRYHLFGRSVTVAQKMESHGVKNRLHVSEATKSLIEKDFVFEERGHVMVGKELGARAANAAAALKTAVQRDQSREQPMAPNYAYDGEASGAATGAASGNATCDAVAVSGAVGSPKIDDDTAALFLQPGEVPATVMIMSPEPAPPPRRVDQQQVSTTLDTVTKAVKSSTGEDEEEQEPIGLFMVKGSFAIPVKMWFPSDDTVQWPPVGSTQEDVVW